MRTVGRKTEPQIGEPSAAALRRAGTHIAALNALAAISSTGIAKGIYRFASPAAAQAQVDAGRVHVVAANAARRTAQP